MTQETSTATLGQGLAAVYGDVFSARNLSASFHLILNFGVGLAAFIAVVTLLTLTVGLLVVLPVAVVTAALLWVVLRGFTTVERVRLRTFLQATIDEPPERTSTNGYLSFLWDWATDATTWRAILYFLTLLPFGILTFAVTLAVWTFPFGLVVTAVQLVVAHHAFGLAQWSMIGVSGLIGLGLIVFIPFPIRVLADLNRALGEGLLGAPPTAALERQVSDLTTSRSQVVDAAEQERRRIERDLHDGAQQRLVSLAMNLGMAKEKLDADPEGAKELVETAHVETKRALVELRDLARGIHPALLEEKGLEAALVPVATLSPVPVSLNVDVAERPAPGVETIAYFVVSEALANVTKHSRATRATVSVVRQQDRLVIEVTDDGIGGADPHGGGLTGLRYRVEAADGWFSVTSPSGGPTTVIADLPAVQRPAP